MFERPSRSCASVSPPRCLEMTKGAPFSLLGGMGGEGICPLPQCEDRGWKGQSEYYLLLLHG